MAGYSCVAENKVGTIEKLFSLTVQGKPPPQKNPQKSLYCDMQLSSLFAVPPRITGPKEEEVSVTEGHMVSLLCDVQAYPPPEITWTKDGQVLHFSTSIHILPG